jgi:hypothetical protein
MHSQETYYFEPETIWRKELNVLAWTGGVYANVAAFEQRRNTWTGTDKKHQGLDRFLPTVVIGAGSREAFRRITEAPWLPNNRKWVENNTDLHGLCNVWAVFPRKYYLLPLSYFEIAVIFGLDLPQFDDTNLP